MKKVVLTFGLIAGAIMAVMMFITMSYFERIHAASEIVGYTIGYTTMIVAFLMVYFGIRSYRDNVNAGTIGFGKAFKVGILITLVASVCYVAAWEVIYHTMMPDFVEKYAAKVVEKAQARGATEAQIAAKKKEMSEFAEMYKNPVYNVGMTFAEVFPVGLLITLASAWFLSRRKSASGVPA